MKSIWPKSIDTPHVPLGIDLKEALEILNSVNTDIEEETVNDELSYRVRSGCFDMAVYVKEGKVSSVWYNDQTGRLTPFGRKRKIELYLERYGDIRSWEKRLNNGWMTFYFNDAANVAMVYGNDKDVIRINENIATDTTEIKFIWRTENITAQVKSDNVYLKIGKYIEFEQKLEAGEYGWTNSKENIPDTWHISDIVKDTESFYITTKEHGQYIVNASNFGTLSSAILGAGEIQDHELEEIWKEHAKVETET